MRGSIDVTSVEETLGRWSYLRFSSNFLLSKRFSMEINRPRQTTTTNLLKNEPGFLFFVELFKKMNKERDFIRLEDTGGVRELAKSIGVDVNFGIDTTPQGQKRFSMKDRREAFGENTIRAFKPKRSFAWIKEMLNARLLTALIISAMVTTVLQLSFDKERENTGWIDGMGIWIIVLIFVLSGLGMDYGHFRTRRVVDAEKDVFDVIVLRDGREKQIKNFELLVGDILVLTKDVIVAADGLLFVDNDLFINEEAITGDSTPIKKKLVEDPFCRSGTQVTNGNGKMLVTAVGEDNELSQIMKTVTDSTDHADEWMRGGRDIFLLFSLAALCLGVLSFTILLIRWIVDKKGFPVNDISDKGPVQFLILAIMITVVELPNGLLLFSHFSFIFPAWKFAKDGVMFLRADAINCMPNVDTICFDKTGTLTENRLTVVKGWFQGTYFERAPKSDDLDPLALELITENACLNSEAFFNIDNNGSIQFVGNQTECALLVMAKKLEVDYVEVRLLKRQHIIKNYGFNSDKKMSSVIVRQGHLMRMYNKGAAKMVLNKCTQYIDPSGSRNPIFEDKRIELENIIETMATQGLRTLALSYIDLDLNDFNFGENGESLDESGGDKRGFAEAPEDNLVLLAIVGIKDPMREGVSEVVEQFKKVGITIKMITGDSLKTAKQVARECGVLTDGLAMEGKVFRRRIEEDIEGLKKGLPNHQVLAQLSPSDKQKLVELLESMGGKVAVVGDGTNDALAMKEATVGIAMGTNSTEVEREAADVVILNDNISSTLTYYLWSRCFLLSCWGYFQYRLSVTWVVWIVLLVSVCVRGETPLNAHQFLWVEFITDILVVLAFATESPPKTVPDDESYQTQRDPMNEDSYLVHVLLQSLYQITVILCTFFSLSSVFERYNEDDLVKLRTNSLIFNIFIFMQMFNSLNCRKVFDEYNIFEGIINSPLSLAIRIATICLQLVVMLTPVRTLFKVTELTAWEWLYSIGISVVVIPLSTLIKYVFKTMDNNRRGYQRLR